ncbi:MULTISPECIES: hypothetical protein [Rufibacter]|uniref:Uncharacterized protein n=1 Tax=Rufibacter quisquiliarum TaxID=1549639 RepID=A0A839GDC7_9BACT|nr:MULTISPECIES: hypothetical protein [Rufibacter]MBA9076400.1 hypothetical protein [Rufibacter quisquiliarum]
MRLFPLLLILCLVFSPAAFAQGKDAYSHDELLNYYQKAAKDEDVAKRFLDLMGKYPGKDPLKLGYKAVSHAIMAKHVWSPYSKIKYLKQSAAIFDQAVALDQHDPELRFLRYSIENYIPRYLNMSPNLVDDKKIFMAAILRHPRSGMPVESVRIMKDFLLRKELVTGEEKQRVENLRL